MSNLPLWVALNLAPNLGAAGIRRLLNRFGGIQGVFDSLDRLPSCKWLTSRQKDFLQKTPQQMNEVEDLILSVEDRGVSILTIEDDGYPANLRGLDDAPPVLYVDGSLLAEDSLSVAIVGTRSPTQEGENLAHELAGSLASGGVTIVSGLAVGIDTAAHVGALDADGRTIAVLGSGIYRIHPRQNRELWGDITVSGAVISEFPPTAGPSTKRFMARNRIQAGLSLGVIVVESREKGGAMVTARKCLGYGRRLFAVDWSSDKPEAEGTRSLINQANATPISSADEAPQIIALLKTPLPQSPKPPKLPFEPKKG